MLEEYKMREPDWKTMYRILEEGIEKCIGCLGHDRISLEVEKYLFAALQDADDCYIRCCGAPDPPAPCKSAKPE